MRIFECGTIETNGVTFRAIRIFGVTMFRDPSYECLGILRGWFKVRNWSGVKWIALCALLLCGCVSRTVTYQGVEYTHRSFGVKQSIGRIAIEVPNGPKVSVDNYNSDGAQAIGVAVDAAVSAAVKSMAPTP